MTTNTPEPRVFAWMEVLERIQHSLGQSLQQADDSPPPPPAATGSMLQPLQLLTNRLAQLQECLDKVERNAGEVDQLLSARAEAVRGWLDGTRAVREKLMEWQKRVV